MSCGADSGTTAASISSFGAESERRDASPRRGRWWLKLRRSEEGTAINPDFRDLFAALRDADARHLVVGSLAVAYHASPRYSKDIDLWVDPAPENARRVWAALEQFGAPLGQLTVQDLSSPDTVFQIGVEPNRIDLLTSIGGLSFEAAWQRRVESTYAGIPIFLIGLDDLITAKRAAGRPQDLLDLELLERAKQRP